MRCPQRHVVRLILSSQPSPQKALPLSLVRHLAQSSWPSSSSSPISFTSTSSLHDTPLGQRPDAPKPDARTLQLGKTLRTLQSHLPTLLAAPLPQEILSPTIRLQLFPSTHPHLPSTTGRVAYHAALWTSPITWGCVPLLGNVGIEILSERMSKPHIHSAQSEKLYVKWRTKPSASSKTRQLATAGPSMVIPTGEKVGSSAGSSKIAEWLGRDITSEPFTGLFIFEFDDRGRIQHHVIEMVDQGPEREMGRVVTLTEWLMRRFTRAPEVSVAVQDVRCRGGNERNEEIRR